MYWRAADTREPLSSILDATSRIGGPPIPMEFREIVVVTYIISADCMSLSADPVFFALLPRPLSVDGPSYRRAVSEPLSHRPADTVLAVNTTARST